MTKKRIHLAYGIVVSAAAVIAGICLIAACVGIYRSGEHPFTRESIAAAWGTIAVPVYVFLALVISGWVLDIFLSTEKAKLQPQKQYGIILQRLHKKFSAELCGPELRKAILKEQNRRNTHKMIAGCLLIGCSIAFLRYSTNMQYFTTEDINGSVVRAVVFFFICLIIPFGYGVFTAYWNRRSVKKEIELVKQAIAAGAIASADASPAPLKNRDAGKAIAKYGILAVSIGILVYGFLAGGTADVLAKAAAICTECVGLG